MVNVIVYGVALASLWMWLFLLTKRKECDTKSLKKWLMVIVPQGILIAFALMLLGIV